MAKAIVLKIDIVKRMASPPQPQYPPDMKPGGMPYGMDPMMQQQMMMMEPQQTPSSRTLSANSAMVMAQQGGRGMYGAGPRM